VSDQSGQSRTDALNNKAVWAVAVLALLASITGVRNGFAYDDVRAIVLDTRFHSLANVWQVFNHTYWLPEYGASLYRPLTLLMFSLEWAVGHGSPLPFHVVNIVLYAGVCVAVLGLARQVFDERTAIIGTAIFAVHPLHVEAVANIVGQGELFAALFVVVSVSRYIAWTREGDLGIRRTATLCLMYAVAIMFKENAIVLPGLFCAVELLAFRSAQTTRQRVRRLAPTLLFMAVVGLAFVIVRTAVIGRVSGAGEEASFFVGQSYGVRVLTMLPVVMEWIRLFIWPASLSADYSSPRIDIQTSFHASMLSALAVVLGSIAIVVHVRKEYPALAFAFAWAAIALLIPSNLIVVTGFVLAERALFLPSVGVALLIGAAISAAMTHASVPARRLLVGAVALILVAGIVRSSYRNPVWKDNETLFRQTAEDVPYSWKAHIMLGEHLAMLGKGEGLLELRLGARLAAKNDVQVRYLVARRFHLAGKQAEALPYYAEAMALAPDNPWIREDAAYCLAQIGKMSDAISIVNEGLRRKPGDVRLVRFMRFADSVAVAAHAAPKAVN
jgi:hypothetical protein